MAWKKWKKRKKMLFTRLDISRVFEVLLGTFTSVRLVHIV